MCCTEHLACLGVVRSVLCCTCNHTHLWCQGVLTRPGAHFYITAARLEEKPVEVRKDKLLSHCWIPLLKLELLWIAKNALSSSSSSGSSSCSHQHPNIVSIMESDQQKTSQKYLFTPGNSLSPMGEVHWYVKWYVVSVSLYYVCLRMQNDQIGADLCKQEIAALGLWYKRFLSCSISSFLCFYPPHLSGHPTAFLICPPVTPLDPPFSCSILPPHCPKSFFLHLFLTPPYPSVFSFPLSICHQVWNESAMSWLREQRGWERVVCHRRMILTGLSTPKSPNLSTTTTNTHTHTHTLTPAQLGSSVTENSAVTQGPWIGWLLITIKPTIRAAGGVADTVGHASHWEALIKTALNNA